MRLLPLVLASSLAVSTASSRPPLPDAKGHDLRGPALAKGMKLTVKTTITLKDADLETKAGGKRKLTVLRTEDREIELNAVDGRQPTRLTTKVLKEETRQSYPDRPFPPEKIVHPLSGRTVVSRRENGEWANALDKGKAEGATASALSRFRAWSAEDGLFPARAVAVGSSWDVSPVGLADFPCADISPSAGSFTVKGKATFRAIDKYQGQRCAVVNFDLALTGKEKDGLTWAATLKMTIHRSLADGVNLKTVCDSWWRASRDGKVPFKMSGKQKQETVVTVKRPR